MYPTKHTSEQCRHGAHGTESFLGRLASITPSSWLTTNNIAKVHTTTLPTHPPTNPHRHGTKLYDSCHYVTYVLTTNAVKSFRYLTMQPWRPTYSQILNALLLYIFYYTSAPSSFREHAYIGKRSVQQRKKTAYTCLHAQCRISPSDRDFPVRVHGGGTLSSQLRQ